MAFFSQQKAVPTNTAKNISPNKQWNAFGHAHGVGVEWLVIDKRLTFT